MAVGDIDMPQCLSAVFDPLREPRSLLGRHRWINEDGVGVAKDQRGCDRLKHPRVTIGRLLGRRKGIGSAT
jgi:hypothetical protein